jgi:ribA/ribD-fused uncharacterized protein
MTSTHSNSNKKDGSSYIFFWKVSEEYGWASQWYPSTFTADISLGPGQGQGGESGTQSVKATFPTAEHWMMTQKALLFGDYDVAREVLAITESRRGACAEVKALGRKVRGFEEGVWERAREGIVLEGTLLKFKQNEELRRKLEGTGDRKMVEASPHDKVWGIGMGEKKAIEVVRREGEKGWKGKNLLGKALNSAREVLRKETVNSDVGV